MRAFVSSVNRSRKGNAAASLLQAAPPLASNRNRDLLGRSGKPVGRKILFIGCLVVLVDQATKAFFIRFLSETPTLPVIPGIFHLTLLRNPGVAFGLLRGYSLPVSLATVVILLSLLWIIFQRFQSQQPSLMVSLGLILGGAVGNLIDRIRFGGVTDFLDFRMWPVFNVADSCITIGAVLMAWELLQPRSASQ